MVYQTNSVKTDSDEENPFRSAARSSTEFAEDVLTLAELQAKLLALESKDWARAHAQSTGLVVVAAAIAVGLTPIALLALASFLIDSLALPPTQALLLAVLCGAVVVSGLLLAGYVTWKPKARPFELTRREWNANVKWFRNIVRRQGRRW